MATLKDILAKHILSDVQLCYFETFAFSRKFNLVLMYKEPRKHEIIEGITDLNPEDIKEQLRVSNTSIKFAEGLPLNWSLIMEEVRENPKQFREAGGWDCLASAAMDTELVIKMEPVHYLTCFYCDKKVRIRNESKTLIVVVKVAPDQDDIEERNYIFYCSNYCRRKEKPGSRLPVSQGRNSVERQSPVSRELTSTSRQQRISSNSAICEDKERRQKRAPAQSSSSSQQSGEADQMRAGNGGEETRERKPEEVSQSSNQTEDQRRDGPPAKKARMEMAEAD